MTPLRFRSVLSLRLAVVFLSLAVLFGSASLLSLGSNKFPLDPRIFKLRYILVASSLSLLLLIPRTSSYRLNKRGLLFLSIWIPYGLTALTSAVVNRESMLDSVWLCVGVPVIFFTLLPRILREHANRITALALVIGHVPYIVASVLSHPIRYPYRGVMGNPNQMGGICMTIAVGLYIELSATIVARHSTLRVLLISLLLLGCFSGIALSGSRTNMLSFFVMALFLLIAIGFVHKSQAGLSRIVLLVLPWVVFSILSVSQDVVLSGITQEHLTRTASQRILGGREEIWSTTLEEATLLGHGRTYFTDVIGLGAHNSLIQILGEQGIVAAGLMAFYAFLSVACAYGYGKRHFPKDPYAFAPLYIVICFWAMGMGEGMWGSLGRGLTLAFFSSVGVLCNVRVSSMRRSNRPMSQAAGAGSEGLTCGLVAVDSHEVPKAIGMTHAATPEV